MAFLGEVPPARLEGATGALEALSPRRLALRLSQIGQFPQEGGLWWLGPEPCPELFALREELTSQLERRGLWYQPGEFRPHVTLARKVSFWCGSAPPPTLGGSLRPGEFGALPADSCRSAL